VCGEERRSVYAGGYAMTLGKTKKQVNSVWRIRLKDRTFGERYSDGGDSPLFGGKVDECQSAQALWTDEAQLKAHITRVLKRNPKVYINAEIVEFELVERKTDDLTPRALGAAM